MFYGAMVWDPWLIVSQIVCLQCLYYLSLGLFMWILVGSRVPRLTLLYFFDYSVLSASTVTGWCILGAFFLSALAGAGFMFLLIERAKKCLDFAASVYIIHLFICLIYGGWPSIIWWVSNGICLAVMALLGEWLCIRRELMDIPIRSSRANVQTEVREEYSTFAAGMDDFGDLSALAERRTMNPVKWWTCHGANGVYLQSIDTHILSQVASSSSAEINWSTNGWIHSVKRNKGEEYTSGPQKEWDVEPESPNIDLSLASLNIGRVDSTSTSVGHSGSGSAEQASCSFFADDE